MFGVSPVEKFVFQAQYWTVPEPCISASGLVLGDCEKMFWCQSNWEVYSSSSVMDTLNPVY